MNERIRQLDKQAVDYAMSVCDANGLYQGKEYLTVVKEKFAELIVKECVSILMTPEYPMNHPEELTDYNRGWVDGRLLGIEHIKEQFGIEE